MKKPGEKTEHEIIERNREQALAGPSRTPSISAELDRLFAASRDRVYALCLRRVRDPAWAEELTQETLLVAYQRLPEFQRRSRFSTWIFGIANNICLRSLQKRREYLSEDGVLDPEEDAFDLLRALRVAERNRVLEQAIAAALDPTEQEAVRLRYIQYLSQDDITALLALEGTGARGLLQRCRRKLRRELLRRLEEMGHGPSLFLSRSTE